MSFFIRHSTRELDSLQHDRKLQAVASCFVRYDTIVLVFTATKQNEMRDERTHKIVICRNT